MGDRDKVRRVLKNRGRLQALCEPLHPASPQEGKRGDSLLETSACHMTRTLRYLIATLADVSWKLSA